MSKTRPQHKKTVSFSDFKNVTTSDDTQYFVKFSPKLIPLHISLLLWSIFSSDLSPENVTELLYFHLLLLVASQLLYGVLFNGSIVELKRSKQHELKFTIGRDYNVILVGLILCCLAIVPIYLGLILFGAPFSTYFIENVYLAAHLSFLSYPIVLAYLNLGKQSHFYKYIISIMVGAWLGAIVIPLDWDRPWQNWPLPIIGGGYLGAIVGYSLCELV